LDEIQENIFSVRQIIEEIDVLLVDSGDFFVEEVNPVSFDVPRVSLRPVIDPILSSDEVVTPSSQSFAKVPCSLQVNIVFT
jgi:hypothetical protein